MCVLWRTGFIFVCLGFARYIIFAVTMDCSMARVHAAIPKAAFRNTAVPKTLIPKDRRTPDTGGQPAEGRHV